MRPAFLSLALLFPLLLVMPADEARETILAADLKAHVAKLCDDMKGRATAQEGEALAGRYVADAFKASGLKPAGQKEDYLQTFEVDAGQIKGTGCNVLGRLEGSDASLKKEIIAVGAHLDAVGGKGADDNASGLAAVLEMADAVGRLKTRPKRTLLFCAWGSEEFGLRGSRHFAANPTVPLKEVVLYINLDMVGRCRDEKILWIAGAESAEPSLRPLLMKLAPEKGVEIKIEEPMIAPISDCKALYEAGKPILTLYTLTFGAMHPDYHKSSDTADKLDYGCLEKIARVGFDLLRAVGDLDKTPKQVSGYSFPHPAQDKPKK